MKLSITALVLLLILAGCSTKEQVQDYKKVCEDFDEVDREMLDLINRIKAKYQSDAKFISNFTMEQVYWVQYRDHHLKTIYPKDWKRHYRKEYGKEVFNLCKCEEMTRFTINRISELTLWLNSGPDSESDCPSLWNE